MSATTLEQMITVLERHFEAESVHDIDRVLATLTEDVVHDVVGNPTGPVRGREAVRAFYLPLFSVLKTSSYKVLHRYHGENFLAEDAVWEGTVNGPFYGIEGRGRLISHRLLTMCEFRDGLISRENVWVDVGAIMQQLMAG